jgi:catechol-2,3-dioxygenase
MRTKKFKHSQRMFKQLFLAQNFYHKHLCANVYKMYEFNKNQMPYCPSFGPLIEHGPH